jgi:hypothetical protein
MSGQVSVWVPLVVALLGVLGVIGGQVINAWREDRRWKREQQREELRWQRQKLTENAKLSVEHANQWREMKVRIYGDLINALKKQLIVLRAASFLVGRANDADSSEGSEKAALSEAALRQLDKQFVDTGEELSRSIEEANLVGSGALMEVLREASELQSEYSMAKFFYAPGDVEYNEELRSALESCRSLEERVRKLVRHELMVSNVKIDDDPTADWWEVLE